MSSLLYCNCCLYPNRRQTYNRPLSNYSHCQSYMTHPVNMLCSHRRFLSYPVSYHYHRSCSTLPSLYSCSHWHAPLLSFHCSCNRSYSCYNLLHQPHYTCRLNRAFHLWPRPDNMHPLDTAYKLNCCCLSLIHLMYANNPSYMCAYTGMCCCSCSVPHRSHCCPFRMYKNPTPHNMSCWNLDMLLLLSHNWTMYSYCRLTTPGIPWFHRLY